MHRHTIALVMVQLALAAPVLAHSEHEHVSDLQIIINGVGIILIVLAAARTFLIKR